MTDHPDDRGRLMISLVAALSLLMQAIKLGSRYFILGQAPTGGMWAQLGLFVLLCIYLFEGKRWARVVLGMWMAISAVLLVVGAIVMDPKLGPAMRFSLIGMAAISVAVAGILGSSNAVREYVEAAEARSK
jgi:hypothetical protein